MYRLYPEITPYQIERLNVDEQHTLYIEQCGNPEGLPVLFLHGGPGIGCHPLHRRFFDPERYRIVLFDQRGSGQSTPSGCLEANTTWDLVFDMERLREHLGIRQWLLFGSAWGSTLALAYAQAHPLRVRGAILRGVFLCRPEDVHWLYQEGANRLFPDAWERFVAPIPSAERDDLLAAYYRRLNGQDELERMRLARSWNQWELTISQFHPNSAALQQLGETRMAGHAARLRTYYLIHHCFLEPNQLLEQAPKLADIPGLIIQGRHDLVAPLDQAWALAKRWSKAELKIVSGAGHAVNDLAIIDALVWATRTMVKRLEL